MNFQRIPAEILRVFPGNSWEAEKILTKKSSGPLGKAKVNPEGISEVSLKEIVKGISREIN